MSWNNDSKKTATISISPGSIVCTNHLEAVGEIMIGSRTIVHPHVTIIAEAGPIFIGEGNIIEEQCVIANRYPDNVDPGQESQVVMFIGDHNVFEVGSHSEALKIGDNNILESKAHIGRGIALPDGCIIGAHCLLMTRETLAENTVVFPNGERRQRQTAGQKWFPIDEFKYLHMILKSHNEFLPDGTNIL